MLTEQNTEIGVIEYNSRGARLVLNGDIQKGGCFPVSILHLSNHIECWAQVLWTKPLSRTEVVVGVEFTDPPSEHSLRSKSRLYRRRESESQSADLDFWSTSLDLWQAG